MNKYNIPECKTRNFSFVNLGAALATATCGGYIIITTGLLIAAATGELNGRKTVIIPPFFSFFYLFTQYLQYTTKKFEMNFMTC